jgi:hypothetical protein
MLTAQTYRYASVNPRHSWDVAGLSAYFLARRPVV